MSAWLQKTPKGAHATNAELYNVGLPDINEDTAYLPVMLEEIGTVTQTGMGVAPLSWQEIQAWSVGTNQPITPNEGRALRMMSAAFAGVLNSSSELCPVDSGEVQQSMDMVNIHAMIAMAQK